MGFMSPFPSKAERLAYLEHLTKEHVQEIAKLQVQVEFRSTDLRCAQVRIEALEKTLSAALAHLGFRVEHNATIIKNL